MLLSVSLLRMICLIVWRFFFPFRRCLSITAAAVWLFSMDSWWSLEECSSSLTGETEALQCHCFWMNLTVVGESASCQNIWVRPHTAFRIVIVGLFQECMSWQFFYLHASFIAVYRFFIGFRKGCCGLRSLLSFMYNLWWVQA